MGIKETYHLDIKRYRLLLNTLHLNPGEVIVCLPLFAFCKIVKSRKYLPSLTRFRRLFYRKQNLSLPECYNEITFYTDHPKELATKFLKCHQQLKHTSTLVQTVWSINYYSGREIHIRKYLRKQIQIHYPVINSVIFVFPEIISLYLKVQPDRILIQAQIISLLNYRC